MSRKTLKAYCNEEEYEIVKRNAARYGKTVSGYIREVALYGRAFNINYDAIMDHTKIINTIGEEIRLIIKMLVETKQAYPIDVQRLISLLEKITENQRTMLQRTLKEHENLHKLAKSVPKCP